jgi:hypothetical protein
MTVRYDDGLTVREARQAYFDRSGFDTSGYEDRWVKLPAGPLAFYLPNLQGRKKCIAIHDLDHVVTEYETDWRGELRIAGFEIGMGCGRYWFGWMVNSQGVALGVLLYPRDVFRAYVRGRRCTMSLFDLRQVDDRVLERTVGALREEMGLDRADATPAWRDRLLFAGSVSLAFVANGAPLLAIGYLIYWAVT